MRRTVTKVRSASTMAEGGVGFQEEVISNVEYSDIFIKSCFNVVAGAESDCDRLGRT